MSWAKCVLKRIGVSNGVYALVMSMLKSSNFFFFLLIMFFKNNDVIANNRKRYLPVGQ